MRYRALDICDNYTFLESTGNGCSGRLVVVVDVFKDERTTQLLRFAFFNGLRCCG